MTFIAIGHLKRYVAALPETTDRTIALERRLGIGTGFHGKWYRSQQDHWLGWLMVQECRARSKGQNPDALAAKAIWQRLNCSPMMFWLADAAGVDATTLSHAEQAATKAAAINAKDGAPHGTMMRQQLIWEDVERAILCSLKFEDHAARQMAVEAFKRLLAKNPAYRHLAVFVQPPERVEIA